MIDSLSLASMDCVGLSLQLFFFDLKDKVSFLDAGQPFAMLSLPALESG
jgi:hypothetical protein